MNIDPVVVGNIIVTVANLTWGILYAKLRLKQDKDHRKLSLRVYELEQTNRNVFQGFRKWGDRVEALEGVAIEKMIDAMPGQEVKRVD